MKINLMFLCCILFAFTHNTLANDDSKIVGGVEATPGEFPFMVSLQSGTSHFCGGTLIGSQWVLTAAHCVSGRSNINYVIGAHDRRDRGDNVEVHLAEKTFVHPQYHRPTTDYDFALVKIKTASKYAPAEINRTELDGLSAMFTVAGWGVTQEGQFRLPEKLQKVAVPNVTAKDCQTSYGEGRITQSMICAGYKEGQKDSCQGDSGGPMIEYRSGIPHLVGAVSWGTGCARPEKYGVYAKISAIHEWIDNTLKTE